MPIAMEEPDDDDLTNIVRQLTSKGQQLTNRQMKALSSLTWPAYNAPWWFWPDYFKANKD